MLEIALDVARLQVEAVRQVTNLRPLAAAIEKAKTSEGPSRKPRQRDVLPHAPHHDQPLLAPVGRKIEGAQVEHLARRSSGDLLAIEHNATGRYALQAEAGAADHRLAAADKAGKADDLAGVDRERQASDRMIRTGEARNFQQRSSRPIIDAWERPG